MKSEKKTYVPPLIVMNNIFVEDMLAGTSIIHNAFVTPEGPEDVVSYEYTTIDDIEYNVL